MGGGAAGVIPRPEPILDHQRASLPIPDELMVEIFLRLPTTADLARASAACVSFRLVATGRPFLRRYRKLHPPPLLGFLQEGQVERKIFHPAVPPYPSAAEASAASFAADFSFSFLPAPASDWFLRDTRDGRVLLERTMRVHDSSTVVFPEVVVCDPLHRRYLLLPPIPDEKKQLPVQILLLPTGDDKEVTTADEASFRVIWMAQCKAMLVTFLFSSNTGQWRALPSQPISDLCLSPLEMSLFYLRDYVYGCFYWLTASSQESELLVLDAETMEFSISKPPPEANSFCDYAIVEAGEGRPGMFLLADNACVLSYFIKQNHGGSQWQKVKTIVLGSCARLICNTGKHLLLQYMQSSLFEPGCCTLDIGTFHLEKVCPLESTSFKLHAYSNFPPSLLSSPTVSSGVDEGPEEEMLEQGCATSSRSPWSSSAGVNAGDLAVLQDHRGW